MKQFLLMLIVLSLSSCQSNKKVDKTDFYKVDFSDCIENQKEIQLSDVADTLEFLELKTPKDILVTHIMQVIPVDSFLFVYSVAGVLKFTRDGKYVTSFSQKGPGPEEYNMVTGICVDSAKKQIGLLCSEKILYYDFDGNYITQIKSEEDLTNIRISENILWQCPYTLFIQKNLLFGLNEKKDTVATIPNCYYGVKSHDGGTHYSSSKYYEPFYSYKENLYFKGKEQNDTIFCLTGSRIDKYAVFDMGKYKLPLEYEAQYSNENLLKYGSHYWGIPEVMEDDKYMYITAQRYASIDGDNYSHHEDNFRYICYDKSEKKGFVIPTADRKLKDNILGSPSFWPRWTSKDYFINTMEWYDLKQMLKKGNYKLSPAFAKQYEKWGYCTNALLLFAHKKK